jgi:hypothetical protein
MSPIGPVKPSELPSYGSLFPPEQQLLRAWLKVHESEYDRFQFNVRVGPGYDPGPNYAEEIRRHAILTSQRRMDAVAYRGQEVTIIEVKRRAGFTAIGQLMGYFHHWIEEHPGEQPPKLLLVAGSLAEGTQLLADRSNVAVNLL